MAEVRVQKVESKRGSKRELYARACFFYPQYTLEDIQNMPNRDVALLIKTANKIEASRMLYLTQICAAPHTKKGMGVKKLTTHFKKVAKDG